MQKIIEQREIKFSKGQLFFNGVYSGIGWSFGVTIGFVLISTIIVLILRNLGGLPLIGSWIANIVEVTQQQLLRRTPVFQ